MLVNVTVNTQLSISNKHGHNIFVKYMNTLHGQKYVDTKTSHLYRSVAHAAITVSTQRSTRFWNLAAEIRSHSATREVVRLATDKGAIKTDLQSRFLFIP